MTRAEEKNKTRYHVYFDIGSDSVSAALISSEGSSPKPRFLFVETVAFEPVGTSFVRYFEGMLAALHKAASKLDRERIGSPEKVRYILHAPWYTSQTRMVSRDFKSTKSGKAVVTGALIDTLAAEEIEKFNQTDLKKLELGGSVSLLEKRAGKFSVNGYPTEFSAGMKASNLSFELFISVVPDEIRDSIETTIRHFYNVEVIERESFLSLSAHLFAQLMPEEKNFMFFSVGGTVSEISLFKNGSVSESVTIPNGIFEYKKKVAELSSHPRGSINTLFHLYADGVLQKDVKNAFEKQALAATSEWKKSVTEALSMLGNTLALPSTIYLSADTDVSQFFAEALKTEEFSQYLASMQPFSVILLESKSLLNYYESNRAVEPSYPLIAEALAHIL